VPDDDLEPLPETVQAIHDLEVTVREQGLLGELSEMGRRVRTVVPSCIGLSLSVLEHGVTFTLVASSETIRSLDATQYVDGGPCVQAVHDTEVLETQPDTMAEKDWLLFAQATAAQGIASTLSLPLVLDRKVTGGVNLYASSAEAFSGHHEELAALLGGWAQGAITNADLEFTTKDAAKSAPQVLHDSNTVETATGVLMEARGLRSEQARERIQRAASQVGLPEARVAEVILKTLASQGRE
jgi:GAF domain-containing protein